MYTNRAAQPERVSPGAYHPPWHSVVGPPGMPRTLQNVFGGGELKRYYLLAQSLDFF